MFTLNESIVFLWLAPVFFQILLPLFMLCCWLIARVPALLIAKTVSDDLGIADPSTS